MYFFFRNTSCNNCVFSETPSPCFIGVQEFPKLRFHLYFSLSFCNIFPLSRFLFPEKISCFFYKKTIDIHLKTALCFISNFPLSLVKQRRSHLCSNPNYGRATTSTEPLLILMAAGFHATTPNIPLTYMMRNGKTPEPQS